MNVYIMSIILALLSCTSFAGSNIKGPKYMDIQDSLKKLTTTFITHSDYITYGESVNGKPLGLIKVYSKQWGLKTKRKAVVITGAHHGWEYLNIADRLPNYFLTTTSLTITEFINNGGIIYIVPVVNADGYDVWRRYNANDFDLNRDYPLPIMDHKGLSQPVIKSFLTYLLSDIKSENAIIKLNLNYHCCGPKSDGMLLYPWAHKDYGSIDDDLFIGIGNITMEIFNHTEIQAGQWGRKLYLGKGTATDYFYSVHGALAFNFEGSWAKEHLRLKQHQNLIKYLIQKIK